MSRAEYRSRRPYLYDPDGTSTLTLFTPQTQNVGRVGSVVATIYLHGTKKWCLIELLSVKKTQSHQRNSPGCQHGHGTPPAALALLPRAH